MPSDAAESMLAGSVGRPVMSPTTPSRPDVSPELVLVDPELRRVELLLLPEPGSFARVVRRSTAEVSLERRDVPTVRRSRGRTWIRRARFVPAVAAAVLVTWASAGGSHTPRPTLVAEDSVAPDSDRRDTDRIEAVRRLLPNATQPSAATRTPAQSTRGRTRTRPSGRRASALPQPHSARKRASRARPQPAAAPNRVRVVRATAQGRPVLRWKAVRNASYYNLIVWRDGRRLLDLWPSSNRVLLPTTWTYGGKRRTLSPGRYLWFAYPAFGAKSEGRYGDRPQTGVLVIDRR